MPVQGTGPLTGVLLQRRYRVATRIASGGMGTVFRGRDERLDRAVAIKLLHAHLAEDDEVRRRFCDEARHAAKVRHHNVVAVLDQDEHGGLPFIVMELVDGPSLREVLRARTRLSPGELDRFLTAACAGLSAVHRVGLVHRDVKPENLLHDEHGDVRVADFGIARALESTQLTPAGTVLGSVRYMAPEVVVGQRATFASDQYSLGIVAFEALTGRTPLPAEVPLAAALRHAREVVPPPSSLWPDVPAAVDHVIMTATAKDPDARHPSLDAFMSALGDAVTTVGGGDGRPHPTWISSTPDDATRERRHASANGRSRRSRRPARRDRSAAPPHAQRPIPAESTPHAGTAGSNASVVARPIYIRARMSVLAVVALVFTLVPSGVVVAPVLGFVALRRIDRSDGALRGDAVAGLAIVVGLARLAVMVLQRI